MQPNNILLAIDDDSTLVKLEDEELDRPVARKTLSDRIIYLTRYMPITSGEPILSDMGEARIAHEKQKGLIMPSIYRAPEVLLGMEWDSKVDIWGLAQTVCQPNVYYLTSRDLSLTKTFRLGQYLKETIYSEIFPVRENSILHRDSPK